MQRVTRRQVVQGVGAMGLALVAGCGRWPGQTAPPAKLPRVGVLVEGPGESRSLPSPTAEPQIDALREGLRDLGYLEGQSIVVEFRSTDGGANRLVELAGELVELPVDVILAAGFEAARAAKGATTTIPIVVSATNDPVESGLVASMARPSENITGLSLMAPQLSAKRVELLIEAVPFATRVAVLAYPSGATAERDWQETLGAGKVLGLQMQRQDVQGPGAFSEAFEAATQERAEALVVLPTRAFSREARRIVELAAHYGLPAMYETGLYPRIGGFMSYGANIPALFRRSAAYIDKILKGAKPADLPVEQPRELEFIINLKTAQTLGLTIPRAVLLQATEVVQ